MVKIFILLAWNWHLSHITTRRDSRRKLAHTNVLFCAWSLIHIILFIWLKNGKSGNKWSEYPQNNYSGVVAIGNMFALLKPMSIKSEVSNPTMIETEDGVVIMRSINSFKCVSIILNISKNVTRVFSLNNATIDLFSRSDLKTRCSGLFYDKQFSFELRKSHKYYGCFSMISRLSSIVVKV